MAYIPKETIKKIAEIGLHDYLAACEPSELVRKSSSLWSVKEHDSVVIFSDGWYRYSNGQSGKSALDYLVSVRGMDFMSAAERLEGLVPTMVESLPEPQRKVPREPKVKILRLPMKDKSGSGKMYGYLKSRGIVKRVIDVFVERGLLYQGWHTKWHLKGNGAEGYWKGAACCVFVGFDYNELDPAGRPVPKHGSIRYINSDYKTDASGSDKSFAPYLPRGESTNPLRIDPEYEGTLHVFESCIDLMSYISIQHLESVRKIGIGEPASVSVKDLLQHNAYLSLSSVAPMGLKNGAEYIPAPLERVIEDLASKHQFGAPHGIKGINLHLDADTAGRVATLGIVEYLHNHIGDNSITITDETETRGYGLFGFKDVNDELIQKTLLDEGLNEKAAVYNPVRRDISPGFSAEEEESEDFITDR
jgi:hypothetical protein